MIPFATRTARRACTLAGARSTGLASSALHNPAYEAAVLPVLRRPTFGHSSAFLRCPISAIRSASAIWLKAFARGRWVPTAIPRRGVDAPHRRRWISGRGDNRGFLAVIAEDEQRSNGAVSLARQALGGADPPPLLQRLIRRGDPPRSRRQHAAVSPGCASCRSPRRGRRGYRAR
jgi:hypothetical protein